MSLTDTNTILPELYPFQVDSVETIFDKIQAVDSRDNVLYQLPTGGGKTVIFSEIARKFIETNETKVLILTHRVELLRQTGKSLERFGINNKLIDSKTGVVSDQKKYQCFTAMVETLNNRLQEYENYLENVGLVIVDEAHYNSFRKIFHYFKGTRILGVTATPLSSNKHLPLRDNYQHLIVGESIPSLIDKKFLSNATTYTFNVNLKALKVGIHGDYTTSSSDKLYTSVFMLERLLKAYEEKAKGTKTLIFNAGIVTSKRVRDTFAEAGYKVRHLDSTSNASERTEVLEWFHTTPDAILTSVGILTTGFDEPSVQTIILNRATRSLTLYHQMVGRGSRIFKGKSHFSIIDLGNNALRLGLWQDEINWHDVFKNPLKYLERDYLKDEEETVVVTYHMPPEIANMFSTKSSEESFDLEGKYKYLFKNQMKTNVVLDESLEDHFDMIEHNATDFDTALDLFMYLKDDIDYRLRLYAFQLSKSTENYYNWLKEDYNNKLKARIRMKYLF